MNSPSLKIAWFVTPHGFGHAARASAVVAALQERLPSLHVDIYSTAPHWFFENSINGSVTYHELLTDIGMVQADPLVEDLEQTVTRLDDFLPFDEKMVRDTAGRLKQEGCGLVICDISPLGIAVAERAGIPSVLIENFTWDWIYEGYANHRKQLERHIQYLRDMVGKSTYHIRTEPYCGYWDADLIVGPISRRPMQSAPEIRQRLGIPVANKLVLITMGGIPDTYRFTDDLHRFESCSFLVPGSNKRLQEDGNLILLPYRSSYYHPDLVQAADVVIGKVGYSTLAEVYYAGAPFGFFTRSGFRESPVLTDFIMSRMQGVQMSESSYSDGSWIDRLPELLELPRITRDEENEAYQVAGAIMELIG